MTLPTPIEQTNQIRKRRNATIFDAVAGRIVLNGFIPHHKQFSRKKDTTHSSDRPRPPEVVLFRDKKSVERFEKNDIYFASEHLPGKAGLPNSDLLKALHFYTSEFASTAIADDEVRFWKTLDETALIALGVLVEEAVRELIGYDGDLSFLTTEKDILTAFPTIWNGKEFRRSVIHSGIHNLKN